METTLDDLTALLGAMPMFAGVGTGRLKLIAYVASSVALRPGDAVITEGEAAEAVFVIVSGRLRSQEAGGRAFERGAMLGEISVLSGARERASITAEEPTRAARISGDKFKELLEKIPEFKTALLADLAHRLARAKRGGSPAG